MKIRTSFVGCYAGTKESFQMKAFRWKHPEAEMGQSRAEQSRAEKRREEKRREEKRRKEKKREEKKREEKRRKEKRREEKRREEKRILRGMQINANSYETNICLGLSLII
jgi:hypothetical protein